MTTSRKWRAVITFCAETPTDDGEADALADRLTDLLHDAVDGLIEVIPGSVAVPDLDTVQEL
jgi:hypothetical protein